MSKDIGTYLVSIAEGNIGALGELYSILSARIFNYARTITRNKEMAEDVTHDVFLQIYKHAERLAKMVEPVAYIMVAARNQSLDYLKRDKRIVASLEDISETEAARQTFDRMLIEDAFLQLPLNQRETIYLHHICGLTQKEVSKVMGVPLATVKWRSKKALTQLRTYLLHDGEGLCDDIT